MGDDLAVVNAARVSLRKESKWEWHDTVDDPNNVGFETLSAPDTKLISYLAKHNHWSPFSHCMIKLREKVPIFVARQRFKHMVGFAYNEVSRRYVDDTPEFFTPDKWRKRADSIKQGSMDEEIDTPLTINLLYDDLLNKVKDLYETMLTAGVAPEQARMMLPQSMYTEYIATGSLYAWARAYNLRIDGHAQREIQDLAKQWGSIIAPLFPVSWKALTTKAP